MAKQNFNIIQSIQQLFDPEANIYRHVFPDSNFSIPSSQPSNWSPSEGMKIDAIKQEEVNNFVLEGWSVAIIKEITKTRITCNFIDTSITVKYPGDSNKIAPLGTHTADNTWRDELKVGDTLDIYDTNGKWFLGTILKLKPNKNSSTKNCFIAYRVYTNTGSREDKDKKKYEGWSDKFDEWIDAHSIRLQRPLTLSKQGPLYFQNALDNDTLAPEDTEDILINVRVLVKVE